jgi:ribose transport system ATP-binding protein
VPSSRQIQPREHTGMQETVLEVKSVSKGFPGVLALQKVDFDNRSGEIHALVGENGAGKSTLMKVIAGVYPPDEGELFYLGEQVRWPSPHASKAAGIVVIYQEFDLFPEMNVAENIYIGSEPLGRFGLIDHAKMRKGSSAILRKLGMKIDPDKKVKDLTVAEQQMIEIAKALINKTTLLILDEPTAVLSDNEADILLERLVKLKEEGISIIYISHRLGEVFRIADRVTVLKDGCMVDSFTAKEIDRNRLIEKMVGRDIQDFYPPKSDSREKRPWC